MITNFFFGVKGLGGGGGGWGAWLDASKRRFVVSSSSSSYFFLSFPFFSSFLIFFFFFFVFFFSLFDKSPLVQKFPFSFDESVGTNTGQSSTDGDYHRFIETLSVPCYES